MKQPKVIRIIDEATVLINVGSDDGFKRGQKFEIYAIGKKIFDPDSGDLLGTLDVVKAVVEIDYLYPKMAACKKFTDVNTQLLALGSALSTVSKRTAVRLNVNPEDISGGFEDIDTKIIENDLVRAFAG